MVAAPPDIHQVYEVCWHHHQILVSNPLVGRCSTTVTWRAVNFASRSRNCFSSIPNTDALTSFSRPLYQSTLDSIVFIVFLSSIISASRRPSSSSFRSQSSFRSYSSFRSQSSFRNYRGFSSPAATPLSPSHQNTDKLFIPNCISNKSVRILDTLGRQNNFYLSLNVLLFFRKSAPFIRLLE